MVDSSRLKDATRCNILTLCKALYPDGGKTRHEWRIGDVTDTPGDSLAIQLDGPKADLWLGDGSQRPPCENYADAHQTIAERSAHD